MRDNFGIDVEVGDSCLATLALFPPSFWRFAAFANFSPGGVTTTVQTCLVWNFDNTEVKQQVTLPGLGTFVKRHKALVCGPDGHGGLTTELVVIPTTPRSPEKVAG